MYIGGSMNKMFQNMFFYSCITDITKINFLINFVVRFQRVVDFYIKQIFSFFNFHMNNKNKKLIQQMNVQKTFILFKLNFKQQSGLLTLCKKLNNPIQFLSLSTREAWNYTTMKAVI